MKQELQEIQTHLEQIVPDEPNIIIDWVEQTRVYMARTGQLMAEAEKLLAQATNKAILDSLDMNKKLSTMMYKKFIDTACSEEIKIYRWVERLNRAFTHSCDLMRSRLSFLKEQYRHG